MNYQITATLGPGSSQAHIWKDMLSSGVTSFRLNTSHLSIDDLQEWISRILSFFKNSSVSVPLVLDLQGSKWRLGKIPFQTLTEGEEVCIQYGTQTDKLGIIPVPHRDFFTAASASGAELVLNDAKVILEVVSFSEEIITGIVRKMGELSSGKGITVSNSGFRTETLSEKDAEIFEITRDLPLIRYAISYLKDSAEMQTYRKLAGKDAYLIAKIERSSAVSNIKEIADFSNEIWICRGDLGAELGMAGMAESVHGILTFVKEFPVPVIMAGQILEHMTHSAVPTRSEICYIYESLLKGISGFVLSDETAVGEFPCKSSRACALFRS